LNDRVAGLKMHLMIADVTYVQQEVMSQLMLDIESKSYP